MWVMGLAWHKHTVVTQGQARMAAPAAPAVFPGFPMPLTGSLPWPPSCSVWASREDDLCQIRESLKNFHLRQQEG